MHSLCRELLASWPDGRVKLFTLMRGLAARKANPDIFARGDHLALAVEGTRREHVVAFARRLDRRWAICAAPRFMTDLVEQGGFPLGEEVWGDTWIRFPKNGPREWTDAVTGEILAGHGGLSVAEAMRHYPGSLLLGGRP
jgi:(1->4)-alpha-D-glucan 1-alpha-D-glucosylmutase